MNIVLIGMPGSGKSTVGAMAAHQTGRSFFETDALIEAQEGTTIARIFEEKGEGYFRDAESAAVRVLAKEENAVISTGGGVIVRRENMAALSSAGVLFFLDRDPADIAGENHGARPLLAGDKNRVLELYEERIALYRKYAKYIIKAGKTPWHTLENLLSAIAQEGLT
jgi:shikimate kinase